MKKILFLLVLVMTTMTSCLKSDLDEVESTTACDLTNVEFEYRWTVPVTDANGNPTGVHTLLYKKLTVAKTIDNESHIVTLKLTVPNTDKTFTKEIREQVSLENLVGMFTVSTAASVTPLKEAPKLGVPGDFSNDSYTYRVTAAAGNYMDWVIKIVEFKK